ncbi:MULTISPECIES: biotin/lipoate--protein ligase family protein [Chelativorans]|jgi:biotin-(acetyl-CoA carboxylase) ligase|uniref:BPL/LPL catalytic domain-containing protein n=1 Tax=Chelativorans sp. (strain BNC1) TaxID=266779 RepID=Q11FJ9_CHESB|nr:MULTISPECIES: biotin/lipoate--protein ligase family protein [Chelativorans]
MSLSASVTARALDLPPLYSLVALREAGDAFAHARAIAAEKGAGTLVWVGRYDLAEFAVVLEPDEALVKARLALYACMNALADALASLAPPGRPITFDWPDAIHIDGVLVGGGRLGWPEGTREDETPDWLVFSAMIRTAVAREDESGRKPMAGALEELGFDAIDTGEIIASFSRHLMTAFYERSEIGFTPLARRWLERFASKDQNVQIADNGDLLVSEKAQRGLTGRRSLAEALASPSWLDPVTGMPWL